MNNKTRQLSISLFLLLLSALSHSTEYEDVIYKKDGSILRGTLIEQDFENKRYKIQLTGGSVFVIEQTDVIKITKEVPITHKQTPATQPNTPNSAPVQAYVSPYENGFGPLSTHNVLFIGPFSHRRAQPYSSTGFSYNESFRGLQVGFQHTLNKNIAMVYTLEKAKLKEITIENESTNEDVYIYAPTDYVPFMGYSEDISFLGKKVMVNYSTNLYKNWRFFAGLGVFHNDYKQDSGNDSLYGSRFGLGMGYSWTLMQLMLRAGGDISHNEKDIDYTLFDFSLTLGINF